MLEHALTFKTLNQMKELVTKDHISYDSMKVKCPKQGNL